MQCLADMLDAPVDRPTVLETTALGAAWLAGSQAGVCPGPERVRRALGLERRFLPAMARGGGGSDAMPAGCDAVRRTRSSRHSPQ